MYMQSRVLMLSDTHTTQVLVRYGSESQKETWLLPLLDGKIRSCFAMTEPAVASSDATNIQSSIKRDGDEYVVNGHKHWTSGTRLQAAQAHTHIRTYTRNAHIYTHWYTGVKKSIETDTVPTNAIRGHGSAVQSVDIHGQDRHFRAHPRSTVHDHRPYGCARYAVQTLWFVLRYGNVGMQANYQADRVLLSLV